MKKPKGIKQKVAMDIAIVRGNNLVSCIFNRTNVIEALLSIDRNESAMFICEHPQCYVELVKLSRKF